MTDVSERTSAAAPMSPTSPMPLPPGTPFADPFGILRRVMAPRERKAPGERCEMCGEDIVRHSHVANLAEHRLLCTCRGCYLLFTVPGAGGLRMRAVPERYRLVSDFAFSEGQWDDLAVPVDLVFLFRQSREIEQGRQSREIEQGRQSDLDSEQSQQLVCCYPSPAGATESELDLSTWDDIVGANASFADVEPDVEAVLLRRDKESGFVCFVVPIDACYELVGVVRQYWSGFQGGTEVWQHIDEFFDDLYRRARVQPPQR